MLAANCPRCGEPAPVSLASPDTIACHHCGQMGSTPPRLATELAHAAATLLAADVRKRQLTPRQRIVLRSRAPGCIHAAIFWLFALWCLAASASSALDQDTPRWVAFASLAAAFSLVVSWTFGSLWLRRRRAKLQRHFAAIPPSAPGHQPRCHTCGCPIDARDDAVLSRCPFCQSDNVVSENAMAGMAHQRPVIGAYDQMVLRSASGPAASSTLAKMTALTVAVVAPVVTLMVAGAASFALDNVRVATNQSRSYAVWPTRHARCVGRVHQDDAKISVDLGETPPRDAKRKVSIKPGTKLDFLDPNDLQGQLVLHGGTVGTVKAVFRTLGSMTNSVELDVHGESAIVPITGLCFADSIHPSGPRNPGHPRKAGPVED